MAKSPILKFFDEDVSPLHGSSVRLELDGSGFGKGALFIEEIEELGIVDNELAVEVDGDLFANERDDHGIPFTDGLVGMDEGLPARCSLGIVPKSAGALFGAVFPAAARFGGVPELNLGNAAKVDATVGLGVEFEFEAELEVAVILFGREEESVAIIVDDAVLDLPVPGDVFEALFLFVGQLFRREGEVFCGVFGADAPPAGEVLAVKKRSESFGCAREKWADQEGEPKQYCFHVVKIPLFEAKFIRKIGKLSDEEPGKSPGMAENRVIEPGDTL